MKTTLSVKRQVSIPKTICDRLDLQPGARIEWEARDNRLIGHPIPVVGWRKLIGIHRGRPGGTVELLRHRREEREHEEHKLAR